jgi:hypothetical protein
MAEAVKNSPDLEIVPLWESLPIVIEALGSSRTITIENAAYVASRLSARWATQGGVTPDESGVSMLIDFIPSKATVVAFRYEKKGRQASVGDYVREACQQFLRYLVAQPLDDNARMPQPEAVRQVAEAIDREYGWFVPAEPGKSDQVVSALLQSDKQLAGLLFNPNLYPAIQRRQLSPHRRLPGTNPSLLQRLRDPNPVLRRRHRNPSRRTTSFCLHQSHLRRKFKVRRVLVRLRRVRLHSWRSRLPRSRHPGRSLPLPNLPPSGRRARRLRRRALRLQESESRSSRPGTTRKQMPWRSNSRNADWNLRLKKLT